MDTRPAPRPRSREEKVAIVRRWQSSGQKQEDFCRTEQISARTLRGYLRLVPDVSWDRQLKESVTRAIEALSAVLKAMEHQPVVVAPPAPASPSVLVPAVAAHKPPVAAPAMTGRHAGYVFPGR